jgi:hypothetical protein
MNPEAPKSIAQFLSIFDFDSGAFIGTGVVA